MDPHNVGPKRFKLMYNPVKTVVTSTINHSEFEVITNLAIANGGPLCRNG